MGARGLLLWGLRGLRGQPTDIQGGAPSSKAAEATQGRACCQQTNMNLLLPPAQPASPSFSQVWPPSRAINRGVSSVRALWEREAAHGRRPIHGQLSACDPLPPGGVHRVPESLHVLPLPKYPPLLCWRGCPCIAAGHVRPIRLAARMFPHPSASGTSPPLQ